MQVEQNMGLHVTTETTITSTIRSQSLKQNKNEETFLYMEEELRETVPVPALSYT